MSNPMRGEADLGARKLRVNFNAWCVAEAALGLKVPDILAMFAQEGLGFDNLRRLIRAFLVDGDTMTLDEVGDFISEVGLQETGKALSLAMERFFPQAEKGKAARPRKAG